MQYFIRAVKYFFYFAILTTLILLALVLIGAVEGNVETMFRDGYNAIWKMAIFFVLVAAVYPKFGFISRRLYIDGDWDTLRSTAITYMTERRYILVSESSDAVTFRCKDLTSRISKMYEDTVVLKKTEDGYVLEGLRKDVIRLAAGLEHRLTQH
ncbi:MAG: hypothetical protein IKW20_06065 [Bacteroidales bacterium]|nr:hypothetical protein [Bacteroidales bacterium]